MISKSHIKLIRSLEHKKFRRNEGLFVAEGPKVVGDLLRAGYQLHSLFATEDCSLLSDGSLPSCKQLQMVGNEELRRISFLQHPQQVLALFRIPQPIAPVARRDELLLALDGVQDPGNLGTIVRIADWFGISTLFCSLDTVDVYNPKVVQATMGSLAHVSVVYTDLSALLQAYDGPVYGTLLNGNDLYSQPLTPNGIIVMGNEGNGISPAVRRWVGSPLLIPNFHPHGDCAESLNVGMATAITCAEFRRRSQYGA